MNITLEIISIILLILVAYDTGYRCGVHTERKRLAEMLIESIKNDLNKRFGAGDTDE